MRLIVDLPSIYLGEIKKLIANGSYSSFEDFVVAAFHNQIRLEEAGVSGRLLSSLKAATRISASSFGRYAIREDLTMLDSSGYNDIDCMEIPTSNILPKGPLWGQYNRIFPVKLTVRILANFIKTRGFNANLNQFQEIASSVARRIGLELRDIDMAKHRSRGDKLSTGLPVGENAFKSKNRFRNQFIGYIDRKGKLIGSPAKLKFVSLSKTEQIVIGITTLGLDFAKLTNPIIDGDNETEYALSNEEINFYLQHILTNIPDEAHSMLLVLKEISEMRNRPGEITDVVSKMNKAWTRAQADTIRSGLVSRLYELGLVTRNKLGVREISYELTSRGKELLQENKETIFSEERLSR